MAPDGPPWFAFELDLAVLAADAKDEVDAIDQAKRDAALEAQRTQQ